MNKTVKEIVEKYLKENGYDGLYTENGCGCNLNNLFPCIGDDIFRCKAGYKIILTKENIDKYDTDCEVGYIKAVRYNNGPVKIQLTRTYGAYNQQKYAKLGRMTINETKKVIKGLQTIIDRNTK